MNCKLHLFDKQDDKGKVPALENSTYTREEQVTDDEIFMSVDPIFNIPKLALANGNINFSLETQIDE